MLFREYGTALIAKLEKMAFKNPWGKGSGQFSRWMKKNQWDEGGKFNEVSVLGAEGAVTDEQKNMIKLTEGFLSSSSYRIYLKLLENSIFQRFLAPFKVSDEQNLKFDFVVLQRNRFLHAETNTEDIENIVITINGNSNIYKDTVKDVTIYKMKPADVFVAKTLIHESIHAYIAAKGFQYPWQGSPGPVQEHNFMATEYRKDIVSGLTEFVEENIINISATDIEAVSWAGLDRTGAWSKLSPELQGDYTKRYSLYSSQIYHSIDGKVVHDDAATYGGNLPTDEEAAAHQHITK
jgi:hypothetical protein